MDEFNGVSVRIQEDDETLELKIFESGDKVLTKLFLFMSRHEHIKYLTLHLNEYSNFIILAGSTFGQISE